MCQLGRLGVHMPRTRVRWTGDFAGFNWHVNSDPVYEWPYSGPAFSKYSEMVDFVGNRTLWNPVDHFQYKGSSGVWQTCPFGEETVHMSQVGGAPYIVVRPEWVRELVPALPEAALVNLSQSALRRAVEQVPEDTSIVNFLIELRNGVKELVPHFRKIKDLLGSGYLWWKFGIEPFIRDLRKMSQTWWRVQRRLKYLRMHNGQEAWIRAHRSALGGNTLTAAEVGLVDEAMYMAHSDDPVNHPAVAHPALWLRPLPDTFVGTAHVNVLAYHQLSGLDTFMGKVDALSAALGVNNPAKIAWNAIPFTWLLEYFVNVGPYLEALKGKPFKGKMEIRAVWSSYGYKFLADVDAGRVNTCQLKPSPPLSERRGGYLVKYYSRFPGTVLRDTEGLLSLGLTPDQVLIVTALTESRLSWDQAKWAKKIVYLRRPLPGPPRLKWRDPPKWFRKKF